MLNEKIHKKISHSFYIDLRTNIKKKLRYCILCLKGPFVEEDLNKEIFVLPGVKYCRTCMAIHNIPLPEIEDEFPLLSGGDEWIVYTIQCKDDSIHHLTTRNLENAIKYINRGIGVKRLRSKEKRPVILLDSVIVSSRTEALKLRDKLNLQNKPS